MLITATETILEFSKKLYVYELTACNISAMADRFEISEAEITDFLQVCFSLVHVPQNLTVLLHAKAALRTLVREILTDKKLSEQCIDLVDDVLITFFELLNTPTQHKLYKKRLSVTSTPVFALHVLAAEFENNSTPLYRCLCLQVYDAVKLINSSIDVADETKEDYLRSMRVLFEFAEDAIKYRPSLRTQDVSGKNNLEKLIDDAISNYQLRMTQQKKINIEASTRAHEFRSKLRALLIAKKPIRAHSHGSPTKMGKWWEKSKRSICLTETPDQPGAVVLLGDVEPDVVNYYEVVSKSRYVSPKALRGGKHEKPDDDLYEIWVYDDKYPEGIEIVDLPPRVRIRQYDIINLRANLFFFDSRFPSIHHLSLLIIVVCDSWESLTRKERLTATFCLFLMLTGISPAVAVSMWTHPADNGHPDFSKSELYITRMEGCFYIIRDKIVQYKKPPAGSENCRNPLDIIYVRLPEVLDPFLEEVWRDRTSTGNFFSIVEPFSENAIALDNANDFLKKHVNTKFALNLTVHRIASSFFPLFCSRYGLDVMIASYVSGQDLRLFKSQRHYLYLGACEICTEYERKAHAVIQALCANIRLERNNIAELQSPRIASTNALFCSKIGDLSLQYERVGSAGHGSGIVSTVDDLKIYIPRLSDTIAALGMKDIITRHNLFMVYAYLCSEFNFELRPRNDLPFSFNTFGKHKYQIISDKMSCRYFEDRLLPVSAILRKLSGNFREGFPKVKKYLGGMVNTALLKEEPEQFFFFFTKRGKIKEFNLTRARKVLADSKLAFPFNWKSPRHFGRTFFHENNIYNEMGDAWVGHQHISRETLGIASDFHYQDMEIGLHVIDNMLDEIGFDVIDYLPEDYDEL